MTALYQPLAGDYPSAAQLATWVPITVTKPGNQNISSQTAFQNDSNLFAAMAASAQYHYRLGLWIEAANSTNGGMNVNISLPAGASISWGVWQWANAQSPKTTPNSNGLTLSTSAAFYGEEGIITVGVTSGNFQFQWCQNTSSANASIVMAGSFLKLQQVA